MRQRSVALCTLVLGISCAATSVAKTDQLTDVSRTILAYFQSQVDRPVTQVITQLLGPPVDDASRAWALNSLPHEGAVTPSAMQRTRLAAAERLVNYTTRRPVDFKVVKVDRAFVGFYLRSVVLVAVQALAVLNDDEFSALVAHELGHDGHADAYQAAIERHDSRRLKELELEADAFAVLAIACAQIDAERLIAAIRKVMRYNDSWFVTGRPGQGATYSSANGRYVPLEERIAFIRAIAVIRWPE